jgi:two-component system sensor histidine kinase PilS (NtrC family)
MSLKAIRASEIMSFIVAIQNVMRKENNINIEPASAYDQKLIKARWSSFKLYNGYRIFIAFALLFSQSHLVENLQPNIGQHALAMGPLGYLIFSLFSGIATWLEKPKLEITLPVQIITDILFILLFMHIVNSSYTEMGLLLVIVIAAASLISDGRLSLFYAAVATIGILLQQFFSSVFQSDTNSNYSNAVTLCIACFAIAWLAHSLARRLQQSERLASQRGLDLKGLAYVNALITHRMKDGVIVVDRELFIKHHNLQADAFLNLEGKDWEEKSLDNIAPEIAALLIEWFSDGVTENNNAMPNILKVSILSRELRISFLPIAENRNQGAIVFIEDWTQIQTQSHQVKLAALGRLTAKIAHEIRNPLSSISHANQLLQEDEEISSSNQRLLQIINDNVSRLDQIIKDVLELNHRDRTNQKTIHLSNFISEFHQQFCAVENIPANHFQLTITSDEATVLFDSSHLNQVLWNLCKNGWRHSMQNENSLQVAVYTTNASIIKIEITDDGEAIPDEINNHLFEPFFTTEKSGTGLGLYISKELAEANGADLQYKPTNTGTKFVMEVKKATI